MGAQEDVAILDALLVVLRKHGAVEFTGHGLTVSLAPVVPTAPAAAGPLDGLAETLGRLDTVLRPPGAR